MALDEGVLMTNDSMTVVETVGTHSPAGIRGLAREGRGRLRLGIRTSRRSAVDGQARAVVVGRDAKIQFSLCLA